MLEVEAHTSDGRALSYQWYTNATAVAEGGTVVSGAAEATYKPDTSTVGSSHYYCIISELSDGATKAFEAKVCGPTTVTVSAQ